MAKETKTEEIQEQETKEVDAEEIKEYIEDDYEESGYKEHTFSLLDNPLEIFAVLFIVAYLFFVIGQFINLLETGITIAAGFEYWLGAIAKLIPAIVLLVACEIYEKIQMLEYNVKINSYYMAQYQMNLVSKINDLNKEKKQ